MCYERRHDTPCAVVGIDIAAGEDHFDSSHETTYFPHKCAMERARSYGIPITLHAGEVSSTSIPCAIMEFGARRIGHGYRMTPTMMQLVKHANVHVEICPTTSVETGGWLYETPTDKETDRLSSFNGNNNTATKNWKDHPAVHMKRYGLDVGLNSDDPSVFDTSLTWQWRIALGKMGFTMEDVKEMTRNAIRAAFCSKEEKELLFQMVEEYHAQQGLHTQPKLLQTHSFSERVMGNLN